MNILNIVYAGGILGVLGIVFGAALVFAEKKFHVETDPRVEAVRACLAGANCGACGFPGCDGYAMAVVEGTAPMNACAPGGPKAAAAIAAIMGAEAPAVEAGPAKKAYVLCQGMEGCAKVKEEIVAYGSCKEAAEAGGNKLCRFACLGHGDCVNACKFGALSIENGIAKVDMEKCVGCGACARTCPRSVIKIMTDDVKVVVRCRNTDPGKDVRAVCSKGCLACGMCVRACEQGAIAIVDGYAQIDYEKCIGCGKCATACKFGVITME